jgi:hypothetical protein
MVVCSFVRLYSQASYTGYILSPIAIRAEISAALRLRDAAGQLLLDQLASYQAQLWRWQETMCTYAAVAVFGHKSRGRQGGSREALRVTDAEALAQAAQLVDRFHGMFLRTRHALQRMRRPSPVVVCRAGQVNVAHQQVNVGG